MRHDKYLFSISESISIISFAVPSEPKTRTLQSVPIAVSVMLSLLVLSAQTSCVPMHEQTITQVIFKRLAKLFFRFMKIFLSLIGCCSIFCKRLAASHMAASLLLTIYYFKLFYYCAVTVPFTNGYPVASNSIS